MTPLAREDWAAVLTLLDAALELAPPAREAWLAGLPSEHAPLRPALQQLLDERLALEADAFLAAGLPPVAQPTPQHIGPYRLLREIGQGGMASVWLAERADAAHQREVALKLPWLGARSALIAERFLRERKILSALSHPNIVSVLDAGTDQGQLWLAMEFVQGQTITAHAAAHALDVPARLRLFLQVLQAVQHAHAQLVIHRDLKPANVLVDASGQVKLLDFGVARLLADDGQSHETELTRQGGRAMTLQYASPEQIAGRALGAATDVYSLGVLLFELLTQRLPYGLARDTPAALEEAILKAEIARPSAVVDDPALARALRGDLDTVVLKALAAAPSARYGSALAMAQDLERHLGSRPILARAPSLAYVGAKLLRRHAFALSALGAVVLALTLGAGTALWQARIANAEAARANAVKEFLVNMLKGSDARVARDKPRGTITAKELLDQNVDRIEPAFAHDADTQLELLALASEIYGHLGDDARFESLQQRRATLALRAHGPNHPTVIESVLTEAWASIEAQDFAAARSHLDDAAARLHAAGLDDSVLKAQWWVAKGESLRAAAGGANQRLGAFEQAAALFERHDPRHDQYVAALANAGTVLIAKERLADARSYYERALKVSETTRDRDDTAMTMLWSNLALIQHRQGDLAAAEHSYEQAEALALATVGPDDSVYWWPAGAHAALVAERGERERADAMFTALLSHVSAGWTRDTGPAQVWEKRGASLLAQGEPQAALRWLEPAYRVYLERPYREFDLRRLRVQLGAAYDEAGQGELAREPLRLARDEYLAKDGPGSVATLGARERWARFLSGQGELEAARAEFQAVLESAPSTPCPPVALAWAGLARLALQRADLAEALSASAQALQSIASAPAGHDVRLAATIALARHEVLAAAGRTEEARVQLDRAWQVLEHSDASSSARRQQALALRRRLALGGPAS